MSVDPRLVERRREVAEDRAKRNVRRLLKFFLFVGLAAGLVWFTLSPWMSVTQVRTTGVLVSDTPRVLVEHRFEPGTPMVLLRAEPALEELRRDPWVKEVQIRLNWPNDVVVRVVERVPRAWVETAGGWHRRAEDGHPLPGGPAPDGSLGVASFPFLADEDAISSELVLGSVEFLMSLPPDRAVGAKVWFENGELWAEVDGFTVRLGRAIEMREKAVSLVGLLADGPPTGSLLILIAPFHPSANFPEGEPEPEPGEGEDSPSGEGGVSEGP